MALTERGVTVLAVATWVVPFALVAALIVVPGDDWSPATAALLAGAVLLFCATAVGSRRLPRGLPPAHARRYHRVSHLTVSVCALVMFLGATAKHAAHAEWGDVLLYGFCSACFVYVFISELRQTRGGASASPSSA